MIKSYTRVTISQASQSRFVGLQHSELPAPSVPRRLNGLISASQVKFSWSWAAPLSPRGTNSCAPWLKKGFLRLDSESLGCGPLSLHLACMSESADAPRDADPSKNHVAPSVLYDSLHMHLSLDDLSRGPVSFSNLAIRCKRLRKR